MSGMKTSTVEDKIVTHFWNSETGLFHYRKSGGKNSQNVERRNFWTIDIYIAYIDPRFPSSLFSIHLGILIPELEEGGGLGWLGGGRIWGIHRKSVLPQHRYDFCVSKFTLCDNQYVLKPVDARLKKSWCYGLNSIPHRKIGRNPNL